MTLVTILTQINQMDKIFYTYNEVAKLLTIHRNTVNKLVKDGKLKSIKITEDRVAITVEEFNRYLKSIGV